MENIWSVDVDSILSIGRSLENLGIRNWALERNDALAALQRLAEIEVPVLGGDVVVAKNGSLEISYDNWYCNRMREETDLAFLSRSIEVAREFILQYQAKSDVKYLFAIVPGN
jgi:hypothetical protein